MEIMNIQSKLDNVNESICKHVATKNKKVINDYFRNEGEEVIINANVQTKTWKLRKKLCPKSDPDVRSAKKDANGQLVSDRQGLEKLYIDTYVNRLLPHEVDKEFEGIKNYH